MKQEGRTYQKPLRRKILIGCAVFIAALCVILGAFGAIIYYNGMVHRYEAYMEGVLRYALTEIDGDDLAACIESGEKSERFEKTQDVLDRIKETYEIEYIYIVKPLNTDATDNMMNVMAGVTAYEKEYEADSLVSLGEYTADDYTPELAGQYLDGMNVEGTQITYVSNSSEFGYEYTGIVPIRNTTGDAVAVLAVDVSANEITNVLFRYIIILVVVGGLLLVGFLIGLYQWFKLRVINPISKIQYSAESFVESSHDEKNPENIIFDDPQIRSADEIQALSEALLTMSTDLKTYMKDLLHETQEKERIGAELNVATKIQSSMLPCIFPAFPDRDEIDIYATMTPAKEVGGDFYDFFMVDDRHLAIVMADVSGKGVPAALFMVIAKTLIKDHTLPGRDLGEVFTEVNNILLASNEKGMFVTVFEGVLDLATGELRYVNAGHERPFICKKGENYQVYKTKAGLVMASFEDYQYKEQVMQLDVGDRIFQYTDGIPEATNADKQFYGMERLEKVLNAGAPDESSRRTLERVKEDIDAFVGKADQFDDITMLGLEYKKKMEI